MNNANHETVSTDIDTSDQLYFEPLTLEDELEIVQREEPLGVIVQLGGQTPLKLTRGLEAAGVTILGTSPDSIDAAEDRRRFEQIAREVGLTQPPSGTATRLEDALAAAERIGYPVLVRPSYVLGGRAMQICYDAASLEGFFATAALASEERPVLIDRFLEDAFEVDVDAISDGEHVVIGGIMQHIEDAGIHSGDSACVLPPYLIGERDMQTMREQTIAMAKAFKVIGLINVQFAIRDGVVYVLEVNPRASRTIPFVSKAIGAPLASYAARVMVGETLEQIGFTEEVMPPFVSVKEAVFPFSKFSNTDPVLGPEMKSTGEVMGISESFGAAFAKAQLAASNGLPLEGSNHKTVNETDKKKVTPVARFFQEMGFKLFATRGTASYLRARGIPVSSVFKVHEGRPNCLDMIVNGDVALLINTPLGKHAQWDDYTLRQAAIRQRIAYTTTMSAARAAADAILSLKSRRPAVRSLQEWQQDILDAAAVEV
jgi:carbamoyl-phosphate synthase large subunit